MLLQYKPIEPTREILPSFLLRSPGIVHLRGDAKATSILDKMVTEIVNHLNDVHSDEDDEDYSDEDDDTMGPDDLSDLDDFLGSLGIDRS